MEQGKIWEFFQNEGLAFDAFPKARQRYYLKYIKNGMRVLNVGVGAGDFEGMALARGADVYSLDPSENSIARLRDKYGLGEKARSGLAQSMPFESDFFDFVLMSEVLEHLEDAVLFAALAEVRRVLKKGGLFMASTPFNEDLKLGMVVCPDCGKLFHKVGHVQSFDRRRMYSVVTSVGLRVDQMWITSFVDWQRPGLFNLYEADRSFDLDEDGTSDRGSASGGQSAKGFMKKDIAIFLPSLVGGGAERVMVTLANGFAQRGYRVDLVLAEARGPYLADVEAAVRVVDLQSRRTRKALQPLAHYLRQHRPHALLSAMNHANVGRFGASTGALCNARRGIGTHHNRCRGKSSSGMGREGSVCAFDFDKIRRLSQAMCPHRWLGADDPPVVLAAGRLCEPKDFVTLLHAFRLVRDHKRVRLIILGEGPLRAELEETVRALGLTTEDVDFPGFVANPYAYMVRAAAFVLSSRWEGLPGVLIEAMACGTAIISTDCPSGPREILQDGRWGTLVPVGDAHALAQAILRTLSTPCELLPDVKRRAQDFSQERIIDQYLTVLGLATHAA